MLGRYIKWTRTSVVLSFVLLTAQAGFAQSVSFNGERFKGNKDATLTLLEYADYQCPYCARFSRETLPQIDREYIATGSVKFVFSHFPLEHHPDAFKAAVTAECAGEQQKFWEMHRRLFDLQESRYFADWPHHGEMLALDLTKFTRCLDSEAIASKVRTHLANGKNAGVKVTPTFFIGYTEPNVWQIKPRQQILGAKPYSDFKEVFDSLLGARK